MTSTQTPAERELAKQTLKSRIESALHIATAAMRDGDFQKATASTTFCVRKLKRLCVMDAEDKGGAS